jgi:hypothetical protein
MQEWTNSGTRSSHWRSTSPTRNTPCRMGRNY